MTTDYSRHGNIVEYIANNHPEKDKFISYRKKWDNNKGDLLFLCIETLSRCNLRCRMCVHSVGYKQTEDMSEATFKAILINIEEMKIPSVCMNVANEPLLDKNIFKRITKIAKLYPVVDVMLNTNAVLLSIENSKRMLDTGLTRLLIGFDAFKKETYEKIRVGAKYETVLNNILNFLKIKGASGKKLPVVRVSLVKTSENEREINEWFDFWKDKVDYISIQEYSTPVLDGSKDFLIPKTSKRKAIDIKKITCEQPFERVIIRGDGDVLPCVSHFSHRMPLGNIKNNLLKDIWAGEKAEELRRYFINSQWDKQPICSKCLNTNYSIKNRL